MNSNYYEQATLWDSAPSAAQVDVAQALKSLIPADVRTVLDAGCGSGIVTNTLVDQWEVTGCDISQTALAQVNAPTILADLTELPFADQQFDLVLSSDVIEHIPDEVYRAAIKEIARVAGKYILIAVPYREILEASLVQCPACRHRFHAHYHQRSYRAADFEQLFPADFEVVSTSLAGERWPFSNPGLSQAALMLADTDYEFPSAVCPACGTQRGPSERSPQASMLERQLCALQYLRIENGLEAPPLPSELLVLLKRSGTHDAKPVAEPAFAGDIALPATLALDQCPRFDHLLNYPLRPYLVADGEFDVLLLPALPHRISSDATAQQPAPALALYDAVREEYIELQAEADDNGAWTWLMPAACPSIVAYRLRVPRAAGLQRLTLEPAQPLDHAACFARAFDYSTAARENHARLLEQQQENARRLAELNDLANAIEARRNELELLHADLQTRHGDLETRHGELEIRHTDLETRRSELEATLSKRGFLRKLFS